MPPPALDGLALARCLTAGTFFLRRYRSALNALNVFPVPDGDTGTNLLVTARAAVAATRKARRGPAHAVAAAAARGALLGARGNSGVIFSQLLRGFAEGIGDAAELDARTVAAGLAAAAAAARAALADPVEGTILSVAAAAAEAAAGADAEGDLATLGATLVAAANAAVDRTTEQLAALRESGVVDAGAVGLSLFLEAPLRFADGARTTAFPRRAPGDPVFSAQRAVGANRFCTEFVLAEATIAPDALRRLLSQLGDSVLVGGRPPLLKLHLHTARPATVRQAIADYGCVAQEKVEDMAQQHRLLLIDAPLRPFGIVAVVPGAGFAAIARDLNAAAVVRSDAGPPSVAELLGAIDGALAERVYVLTNGPGAMEPARAAAALSERDVEVVPTRDIVAGLAALLALGGRTDSPPPDVLAGAIAAVGSAAVSADEPDLEERLADAASALGAEEGGLLTLYYGGRQTEDDVRRRAAALAARYPRAEVEYYAGGQPEIEYWVSFER